MRKNYLDNLKSLVVILVVIYHVIMMFTPIIPLSIGSFKPVQYQDVYMYLVYPWFMIILFIVSGMTSRFYLNNHTVKQFKKSRTNKLLVPSTIGLFVFHWITGYYSLLTGGAFETFPSEMSKFVIYIIMVISGSSVLWYIQMVWLFSMILSFFYKFEKGRLFKFCSKINYWQIILFVMPLFLSAQVLNTPVIIVYRFGLYGFAYLIGYFVFANNEVIDKISRHWPISLIAAIGLGTLYTISYFGNNFTEAPINRSMLTIAFAWMAVLAMFGIMKKFFDKDTSFFRFINKRSFGLYIFHYSLTLITAYYIFPVNIPIILKYVVVAIAAIVGGYSLNELFSRLPFFRWSLLGITNRNK